MDRSPDEQALLRRVLEHLQTADPDLDLAAVEPSHSLTADLGFDSMRLSSFFDLIRGDHGDLELVPWFIAAVKSGDDSVASITAFLYAKTSSRAPSSAASS